MKICGIICEYNPFHNGHKWHIDQTKAILGQDSAVVCLMSGNFVQRGEAALWHKHPRALSAINNGADLVLELPLPYALSGAESFARGAVSILSGMGCVNYLSFGAEDENIENLIEIAQILLEKATIDATLQHLTTGISYASAREQALFDILKERADIIKTPNNILAVEYIKAILSQDSPLSPMAVKRKGAGHDSCKIQDGFASATHIRQCVKSDQIELCNSLIPQNVMDILSLQPKYGVFYNENVLLSRLLGLSPHHLAKLPDVSEGLENRLYSAINSCNTLEEICEQARSKRYPYARVRRAIMNAFLSLTEEHSKIRPPYVKVLAFNDKGREILASCRKTSRIPIITKPAHVERLDENAQLLFKKEALASRLYDLLCEKQSERHDEYRFTPFYVKN